MPETELKLFRRCVEFQPLAEIGNIPPGTPRHLCTASEAPPCRPFRRCLRRYGRTGIRRRLNGHARTKGDLWTHFSVFEVFDNVRGEEIEELEDSFDIFTDETLEPIDLTSKEDSRNSLERNRHLDDWWD